MIELASFRVVNNYAHNSLHWEFTADTEIPNGTTLKIYRSLSSGTDGSLDDYTIVASGQSPYTDYLDTTVTKINDRVWFYKLQTSNGTLLTSRPAFVKSTPTDKVLQEIIRRKTLSLNKFTARNYSLLKRKTWGTHCTRCWDATLQRATDANCNICYGTGWVGGYFAPIHFKGMSNSAPSYNQILMFGEWKPSDSLLYTLNYPLLAVKDIICDDEGKRWIVVQIRTTKKLGFIIEQQAQTALISHDDPIYLITE